MWWTDVRQAARLLVKDWGFTAAAVATLSIGIAVNMLVFTLINGAPSLSVVPTDSSGLAGFVNVPEGGFLARGFVADEDREFGLANFSVKPGWFSLVEVRSSN